MTVSTASVSGRQRVAAAVALLAAVLTVGLAIVVAITDFPQGVGVLGCVAVALVAAWFGVVRGGRQRTVGIAVAVLALVGAAALLTRNGSWLSLVLLVLGIAIGHAAARVAFQAHVHLPAADRPQRPVLFVNPWSGGGKAAKVGLAAEASARGIRTVELRRGDDLEQLVRDAVAAGADGLAAAGGDGTQAIVATAAAEHGLPYACIPAGTRNHFALDLGVDRDDVVGALDAFVDGGEHLVDLGEVNGRVFVNNVSMGLYAEAVQSKGYRDAKIRTSARHRTDGPGFGRIPTRPALDLPRWGRPTRRRPRSWCPTTPTGSAVQSAPGPARESIPGSSVSPSCVPAARTARQGPHRLRCCDSGRHLHSRSTPHNRSRWESTARPSYSNHRSASGSARACCASGSPPSTPGRRLRRCSPTTPRDGLRVLAAIAAGRGPTTDVLQPPEAHRAHEQM